MTNFKELQQTDREIYDIIKNETRRQQEELELIPSENHTSQAVLEALGSILTDKYSEGYPKKRYYAGLRFYDEIETLAQKRAKELFKVPFVNVQPYSGSPANQAVYFATCKPKDVTMGLSLPHGGHLSHGWKVNFSARFYNPIQYGVNKKTNLIDYDKMEELAQKVKPKLICVGATAYPRFLDWERFYKIAKSVNAYLCADIAHIAGLIAADVHPSPVPFVHIVTTTTHKTLRGPRGAMIMVTKKGIEKDSDLPEKINRAVFPGLQGGPHQHQIAAIAVCLKEASTNEFKEYGKQVVKNCKVLASEFIKLGYDLITNGTDNHLILIDLTNKNISGKEAQDLLEKVGINVNKNAIPFDQNPPSNPSGIRLGTPAITTQGMREKEIKQIVKFIDNVLKNRNNNAIIESTKQEVKKMCLNFPLPGIK